MEPQNPITSTGVTIGDVEVRLEATQPSEQRGQSTTLEFYLQHLPEGETQSQRYRRLKDYQQFAGEADIGNLLGGKPHLREHPQDYWPVDSHVVPVVTGAEIYELRDFWGIIQEVDDSETTIVGEPPGRTNYATVGQEPDIDSYDGHAIRSPNRYRLSIDIVPLADLGDYATREELLADLSPTLNQM